MKVQTVAAAEIVDTALGGPGRGFQGSWLPVKLEPLEVPGISHTGISSPLYMLNRSEEKHNREDAVFLGGILSFYGKNPEGSVFLSRARIKGINIDIWA